ncbi:MAG TPA: hypothetical protein VI698_01085 [Nitrososphaerales archaeon]|nr:hypothetical protein [Nitrososphaerales archaeon]
MINIPTSNKHEIEPVKEVVREYLRVNEELEIIRGKFFRSSRTKDRKSTTSYAATLKDYRSIQVKMLHALVSLGVKKSDDLVNLLSNLPDIDCKVENCQCAYHTSIKQKLEPELAK